MEIMNNSFQPSSYPYDDPDQKKSSLQQWSASTSTHDSHNMPSQDQRQNHFLPSEVQRMQQGRDIDSNTIMQLLSRQQQMVFNSSSALFNGVNSSSDSHLPNQPRMNLGMNQGGTDSLSNLKPDLSSQMNNFMSSSLMNNRITSLNGMDNMSMHHQMTNLSSSQFKKVPEFPFESPMTNFISQSSLKDNGQNSMNMGYLQKSQPVQPQQGGVTNNLLSYKPNGFMGMPGVASTNTMLCAHTVPSNGQQSSPQEDSGWEEQYKSLLAYHLQFSHCKVPARFKANPKLGRWVMTQRRQYTLLMQGFPSALTRERIRKLEALGFKWSVRPEPVTTWNNKFHELKGYKAKYGNCMVPQRYQANPQLGTWVHTQRRQYKLMAEGKKSSMTIKKTDDLDSIGFFWAAKNPPMVRLLEIDQ